MSRKPHPASPDDGPDSLPGFEDLGPATPLPARRPLGYLSRHWRIPLATMVLALAAAGTWLWRQAPIYVSTGILWENEAASAGEPGPHKGLQGFPGAAADWLQSPAMRDEAAELLRSAGTNGLSAAGHGPPSSVRITVTQFPGSSLFEVAAQGPEPACSREFLESLMTGYVAWRQRALARSGAPPPAPDPNGADPPANDPGNQAQASPPTTDTGSGAQAQQGRALAPSPADDLKAEMEEKERVFSLFKSTNSPPVLDEEVRSAAGYLASLQNRLAGYELERKLLDAASIEGTLAETPSTNRPAEDSASTNPPTTVASPTAPADPAADLRDLEVLKQEREILDRNLGPEHPAMIKLEADIDNVAKRVEVAHRRNEAHLAAAQKSLRLKVDDVLAAIKECEGRVAQTSGRLAEGEKLRLAAERARSAFEAARAAAPPPAPTPAAPKAAPPPVRILAHASPAARVRRPAAGPLGLAALAGLALGLGIALVAGARDDRLLSLTDLQWQLDERVLGQVPDAGQARGDDSVALVRPEDPRPAYAEAFRGLRSAILFLASDPSHRPKSLLVTSAVQGEGKSTIAANLARTLAMGGAQVLLIDADLRRGTLHERLGLERLPGLGDLLQQPAPLSRTILSALGRPRAARRPGALSALQLIRPTDLPNLFFLARGSDLANPGDRLLGPALDQILARLQKQFDFVLIDSCPVFAADDVTSLAPKVDGTVLAVRNRYSRASQVRDALACLHQRHAKVLGLVFNRADARARGYYYYTDAKYYRG